MKKLLIALGVLAAAFLALFLWVRSWLTPDFIRGQIETQAASAYAGKITLGSVALEFPLSVGVRELKVADPSGATVYLHLPAASASLEPWKLLSQEVSITSFSIDQPAVLVAFDADGQLEMLKYVKPSETKDPSSTAVPAIAVSNLRLNQAAVTVRRPGQPEMVVKPIDAHLSLLGETLTLHSLTVKAMDTVTLAAAGKLTKLLSTPTAEGVTAEVSGTVPPGLLDPKVHGTATGDFAVKAAVSGTPAAPQVGVELASKAFTLTPAGEGAKALAITDLTGKAHLEKMSLVLDSLAATLLGSLKATVSGTLADLTGAPKLAGMKAKVVGGMPAGFLDPKVHGQVLGTVDVAATLEGPLAPEALGGTVVLDSAGLTWKAPDDALEPVKIDQVHAEGTIRKMGLDLAQLAIDLWRGNVTLAGRLDATNTKLTGTIKGVTVGTWLQPMLTARGFGPPLEQLRVGAGVVLAPTRLELKDLTAFAGGLRVEGTAGLLAEKEAWKFQPGSKLAGTFAGGALVTAMALPDLELEGDLGVTMTMAGQALAPVIAGDVKAATMQVRRPKTFSLPVKDLAGTFRFEDGKLDVPALTATVLGGAVKASAGAALDAVPPSYRFQLDAARLQVPEIFQTVLVNSPFASGALDIDFSMTGAGTDTNALKGVGKAAIRTARLAQSPTLDLLANQLKEPKIKEAELDGKFKIIEVSDGRVRLGDFAGTNGKLGPLSGDGSVGFDQTVAGQAKLEVPLTSTQLPAVLQGKTLPLQVKLGGTLTEPKVEVGDIGGAIAKMAEAEAKKKLEAKAQEKLGGALNKLLGGGSTAAPAAAAAATDATTGAAPAPAPVDPKAALETKAKEKVGNMLKGLFR